MVQAQKLILQPNLNFCFWHSLLQSRHKVYFVTSMYSHQCLQSHMYTVTCIYSHRCVHSQKCQHSQVFVNTYQLTFLEQQKISTEWPCVRVSWASTAQGSVSLVFQVALQLIWAISFSSELYSLLPTSSHLCSCTGLQHQSMLCYRLIMHLSSAALCGTHANAEIQMRAGHTCYIWVWSKVLRCLHQAWLHSCQQCSGAQPTMCITVIQTYCGLTWSLSEQLCLQSVWHRTAWPDLV